MSKRMQDVPITVKLPAELDATLRRRLAQLETSLSSFVRSAIEEKLEREPPASKAYELGRDYFGSFDSGDPSFADRATRKRKVREYVRAKHRS